MTARTRPDLTSEKDRALTSVLDDTFKISPRMVEDFADALWAAYEQPGRFIEIRQDDQALAKADYHLAQAADAMNQMSEDTHRRFQASGGYVFYRGKILERSLDEEILTVENIRRVIRAVQYDHKTKEFSGRKQNWALISLTRMARRVWAAGSRATDPERLGRPYKNSVHILLWHVDPSGGSALEYEEFLENFAPVSQKPDTPGPFGRFLEDILTALDIQNRSGGHMTASSALRAWREVYRSALKSSPK